ncbi:hypothetical protein C8R42DRAFT_647410 [Lentinula raphanica]|nr:hypothetical protein C8R42DRAFT_647410 [Lentinula raphanica]
MNKDGKQKIVVTEYWLLLLLCNKIVIDYHDCSVIAKETGFDLSKPDVSPFKADSNLPSPGSLRHLEKAQARLKCLDLLHVKKTVVKSFKLILDCIESRSGVLAPLFTLENIVESLVSEVATLVGEKVSELAPYKVLQAKATALKEEFASVFGDIPHTLAKMFCAQGYPT